MIEEITESYSSQLLAKHAAVVGRDSAAAKLDHLSLLASVLASVLGTIRFSIIILKFREIFIGIGVKSDDFGRKLDATD